MNMTGISENSAATQDATRAAARLDWRGLVRVGGPDAHDFLQNLLTCDLDKVDAKTGGYGALLTPQGKILFDFLILGHGDGYLIEANREQIAELVKRLGFYRLRAKVEIEDVSGERDVLAVWGGKPEAADTIVMADPRLAGFGWRAYAPASGQDGGFDGFSEVPASAYHARRVAFGLPEAPFDFPPGDSFPHDADMDDLNGVAFDKGCFVGQEVVSRMQHRGTARRRIVKASAETSLPRSGTDILADGKPAGTLGSVAGNQGLAMVRLDRVAGALARDADVTADGIALAFVLPEFARFTWPQQTGSGEDDA